MVSYVWSYVTANIPCSTLKLCRYTKFLMRCNTAVIHKAIDSMHIFLSFWYTVSPLTYQYYLHINLVILILHCKALHMGLVSDCCVIWWYPIIIISLFCSFMVWWLSCFNIAKVSKKQVPFGWIRFDLVFWYFNSFRCIDPALLCTTNNWTLWVSI